MSSFMDRFKTKSNELRDKAEETISANSEKIDAGLDKAADAARKATKGKYDDQIGKAAGKAKDGVGKIGEHKNGGSGSTGSGPTESGPGGSGPSAG